MPARSMDEFIAGFGFLTQGSVEWRFAGRYGVNPYRNLWIGRPDSTGVFRLVGGAREPSSHFNRSAIRFSMLPRFHMRPPRNFEMKP